MPPCDVKGKHSPPRQSDWVAVASFSCRALIAAERTLREAKDYMPYVGGADCACVLYVWVCVCVWVCARACVCVCVCARVCARWARWAGGGAGD